MALRTLERFFSSMGSFVILKDVFIPKGPAADLALEVSIPGVFGGSFKSGWTVSIHTGRACNRLIVHLMVRRRFPLERLRSFGDPVCAAAHHVVVVGTAIVVVAVGFLRVGASVFEVVPNRGDTFGRVVRRWRRRRYHW